jgi:hypothetical protein
MLVSSEVVTASVLSRNQTNHVWTKVHSFVYIRSNQSKYLCFWYPRVDKYHLAIPEGEVMIIQIDSQKQQVYIEMEDIRTLYNVMQGTNEQAEYKQGNWNISIVKLGIARMGTKVIRVAN